MSCQESQYQIEGEVKKQVDSLYKHSIKDLNKELDSLCTLNHNKMVQRAFDSLMEVRLENIDAQLKKENDQ